MSVKDLLIIGPAEPVSSTCTPEQMELCLSRILKEIRQQQSLKSTPSHDPELPSFDLDLNDSYVRRDSDISEGEEDLFQFLEDPFENIPLSDYARKIKRKYGDEGFCFIMQVRFDCHW